MGIDGALVVLAAARGGLAALRLRAVGGAARTLGPGGGGGCGGRSDLVRGGLLGGSPRAGGSPPTPRRQVELPVPDPLQVLEERPQVVPAGGQWTSSSSSSSSTAASTASTASSSTSASRSSIERVVNWSSSTAGDGP